MISGIVVILDKTLIPLHTFSSVRFRSVGLQAPITAKKKKGYFD